MVTIGPVVSEEKSFEIVDGRSTEPAYTISSPGAFGSGELKTKVVAILIRGVKGNFSYFSTKTCCVPSRCELSLPDSSNEGYWHVHMEKYGKSFLNYL